MSDPLFIVDNSDDTWKAEHYLKEWCEIARQFDIATGYFDISALLSLDEKWQQLDKIRILMGDEVSLRTKVAFEQALSEKVGFLDDSIEKEKLENDFLDGVAAIVEAIKSKKIECRVYKKKKFHAKAYITYEKVSVRPPVALVGSSNFTKNGISSNIELNVQIDSAAEVRILQDWYEEHWEIAEDVSLELLKTIERHLSEFMPFEVYAKSLQEYLRGHEETTSEWERNSSVMFAEISQYQREAYHALIKIAKQWKGAFLCDGVGLGKTFVGLMLLERLVVHDRKRVVLLVPKSGRTAVWEENIKVWLPDLLNNPYVSLTIYNHTDLLRGESKDRNFIAEFEHIKRHADAFIIDEGHNFRNHSSSRYKKLFELLEGDKQLFMLTATPINNSLFDLKDQIDLFTQGDEKFFSSAPLGIHNLRGYFIKKEREILNENSEEESGISEEKARETIGSDQLFRTLVVQRSRSYVRKSLEIEDSGREVKFPHRDPPQVAPYSLKKVYGTLLDVLKKSFAVGEGHEHKRPLLQLPLYSLYDRDPDTKEYIYYIGDPDKVDDMERGRQVQVVSLIRVLLLKRLESSVVSFKETCENLITKLLTFVEVHNERQATRWKNRNEDLLRRIAKERVEEWDDDDDDDIFPEELKADIKKVDGKLFDIDALVVDTIQDLDQLTTFLKEIEDFNPSKDDKLKQLISLLTKDEDLKREKIIIFTEFQATARYLEKSIKDAGFDAVARVDSTTKTDRGVMMKRFAPFYNKTTPEELKEKGHSEIRILVATDVLSEGVNLQDSRLLINYDLHWNPVRLMQRIGRVDRRMSPDLEAKIVETYPYLKDKRGIARFWNFLPPEELNEILSLYERVTSKTLRISKVFGIEGKRLLTEKDEYEALKDFEHAYEGDITYNEEMHLRYQKLLQDNPGLHDQLEKMPLKIFSGKERLSNSASGVFFCYKLPTLIREDDNMQNWSIKNGATQWFLYDAESEEIIHDANIIDPRILSEPSTPRVLKTDRKKLVDIRKMVEGEIDRDYIRKNQVPVQDEHGNSLKPQLIAWMELN